MLQVWTSRLKNYRGLSGLAHLSPHLLPRRRAFPRVCRNTQYEMGRDCRYSLSATIPTAFFALSQSHQRILADFSPLLLAPFKIPSVCENGRIIIVMNWMFVSLQNLCGYSQPRYCSIWRCGLWGVIGHENRALISRINFLLEKAPKSSLVLSAMWGHKEKLAIYE